jgi:hypothetical protein
VTVQSSEHFRPATFRKLHARSDGRWHFHTVKNTNPRKDILCLITIITQQRDDLQNIIAATTIRIMFRKWTLLSLLSALAWHSACATHVSLPDFVQDNLPDHGLVRRALGKGSDDEDDTCETILCYLDPETTDPASPQTGVVIQNGDGSFLAGETYYVNLPLYDSPTFETQSMSVQEILTALPAFCFHSNAIYSLPDGSLVNFQLTCTGQFFVTATGSKSCVTGGFLLPATASGEAFTVNQLTLCGCKPSSGKGKGSRRL